MRSVGPIGPRAVRDQKGGWEHMEETTSINDIRTAIRELSVRAEIAHKEGRHDPK
jgi:hypothetical protein